MRTVKIQTQELDKKVTLKKPVETGRNSFNEPIISFVAQGNPQWARLQPQTHLLNMRNREVLIAGQKRALGHTVITIRLNRLTALVDPTWKLECEGIKYAIVDKIVLDKRWVELTCITGYAVE